MSSRPMPDAATIAEYTARGWWGERSVADHVRENAARHPEKAAFVADGRKMSWAEYDRRVDELASVLAAVLPPGAVFGVLLPDTPEFHIALCAAERSGTVALGMGARSGRAEIHHLMSRAEARVLLSRAVHRDTAQGAIADDLEADGWAVGHLIEVDADAPPVLIERASGRRVAQRAGVEELAQRASGPNELSMLNSTSGTTGRPKLVMQFANRWLRFSQQAIEAGDFTGDDIMLGAVPGPFGFGLWTAHYAPAMLGMTTVLMERFTPAQMLQLLAAEGVTLLACVSTQFKMLLDAPESGAVSDLPLRAMFTGGEAVPYERAREFEERVGAAVLQFYGSNESGSISYTTLRDPREKRLRTAGRVADDVAIRLFDQTPPQAGGALRGRPGVISPTIGIGYFNDDAANAELFRDGHLLMPDLVEIDDEGWLQVVGRVSDLIIRGGKNISAVEVEEAVESHPEVVMAAAVPVPDALYGERIGVALVQRAGDPLDRAALSAHLLARGMSKHLLPERVIVVDELPRASGEKIAKAAVRDLFSETDTGDLDLRREAALAASGGTDG